MIYLLKDLHDFVFSRNIILFMKKYISIKGEEFEFTDKEFQFANFYLGEARFNATEAAKLAGYSEKTARQQGSKMLTKVNIEKYIQWKASKILEDLEVNQERILKEIVAIAFSDVTELFNDDWTLKPLNEVSLEKVKALDILIKEESKFEVKTKSISINMDSKMKALAILWDFVKNQPK